MKYILLIILSLNTNAVEYKDIEIALEKNDYDKALILTNQIDKNSSDFKKIDYLKAMIALNRNELDKAEEHIELALKNYPHGDVYNLAGGVYGMQAGEASIFSKLGYAKKSKKYMQLAYESDPKNIGYLAGLIKFNIQAPGIAGGDSDAVEPLLKELEILNKKQAVKLRATFLADEEDNQTALTYMNKVIIKNPDEIEYKYNRAFIYIKMEKYDKANQDFTNIISNQPNDWQTNKTWANALYQQGKLSSVEEIYLKQGKENFLKYIKLPKIKGTPAKAWAHYRLGQIYNHLHNKNLAQNSFKTAMTLNPEKELLKRLKNAM